MECLVCGSEAEKVLCVDCFLKQDGEYTIDQIVEGMEVFFHSLSENTIFETEPITLTTSDINNILLICQLFKVQRNQLMNIERSEKMKAQAINKIKLEMNSVKSPHVQVIGDYLIQHIEKHPDDAEKILIEEKTIVKSVAEMRKVAQKQAVNNCAVLTDQEGFEIVLKYFGIGSKAELIDIAPAVVTVPKPLESSKSNFNVKLEDFL